MKPVGTLAAKKSRSKAFRLSPLQPRTIARGDSSSNDAPDIAPLQLSTDSLRVRNRDSLDAVEYPFFPEIGAYGDRRDAPGQVRIRTPDSIPLLACRVLTVDRAQLDARPMCIYRPSGCRFLWNGRARGRFRLGCRLRRRKWRNCG